MELRVEDAPPDVRVRRRPRPTSWPGIALRLLLGGGFIASIALWATAPAVAVPSAGDLMTAIGELAGIGAGYLVCVQLLLIARVPWFERAIGFDRLVSWHRSLGATVTLLVAAHVAFLLVGGMVVDRLPPVAELLAMLDGYPDMLTALAGTILLFVVALASARWLRAALSYEWWYAIHVSAYAAVFLAFFHQLSAGPHFVGHPLARVLWLLLYLGTAAAIVTWRVILPAAAAWRHRMWVIAVVREDARSVSVWLEARRLDELSIRAGDFLLFRFLAGGHWFTAHPYSVSGLAAGNRLRITVGALGDHSRRLRELRPGTRTLVEGPFGRISADLATGRDILLIAGGSGIGPIAALAAEFSARGHRIVLVYRAASVDRLALIDELRRLPGLVLLPMVGRRRDLGFDPLSPAHLTATVEGLPSYEAFVCGPPGMVTAVRASLRGCGVPAARIHSEELSLA